MRATLCLLAAAAPLAACTENATTCQIARATDLPLTLEDGNVVTDVQINGLPARLIVDTGSFATLLTRESVARLALPSPAWTGDDVEGYGGNRSLSLSHSAKFKLGTLEGRNMHFGVVGGKQVLGDTQVDGLLGMDILSHFDLDFDLPEQKLILYLPLEGCTHPSAALAGPLYTLPMVRTGDQHDVIVSSTIAGHRLDALLDSGAAENIVPRQTARSIGLDRAAIAGDETTTLGGLGPHGVHAWRHVLEPVSVGDLTILNMPVAIIDEHNDAPYDFGLGLDFFQRVHVWLSFSSHTVILQFPPQASPAAATH